MNEILNKLQILWEKEDEELVFYNDTIDDKISLYNKNCKEIIVQCKIRQKDLEDCKFLGV